MRLKTPDSSDLDDVDQHEEHQQIGGDEVDRARRLASAEQVEQERQRGGDRRRHGQPGEHHRRQQHEDHHEVGELLQHVVALGGLAARMTQPQMIPDVAAGCGAGEALRPPARDRGGNGR